ncbi:MAG TPA: acetolactate synthase [Solirubrobacterales bacterium]|nr:acetolactate synthase [Solirubrobacterales bacterium]
MATTEEGARAGRDPGAESGPVHGGKLVTGALADRGVRHLFTLSGGHLFSIYDGCVADGIEIVDTRHEQSAAWAAEGYAKATREPGVAALTAGPGVTNGMSAMAGARFNRSPLVVLGGRAPEMRWGSGSLQEIDHLPFVSPVTKTAETVKSPDAIADATARAIDTALVQPSGPTYVDYPLDVVFSEGEAEMSEPSVTAAPAAERTDEAATMLAQAERPVIMAGTGVYWARGEEELQRLAETLGIPAFLNGMGRGCLPADHELCFSRARGKGLKEADVALVVGVPLDFRLGFGGSFGEETKIIWLDEAANELSANRRPEIELLGGIASTLAAIWEGEGGAGARGKTQAWIDALREAEEEKLAAEADELADDRAPLHPLRIYGELAPMLDRDAIVIGDGGDFVSYAGRVMATYEPGCWMDPGPYGCLGAGPGQAIGAKVAHPDRQVVCMLGDGAFGFSGLEFDTMVRHNLPVVGIVGNNGIWALEYHPMKFLYGYQVAAELRPATRYDEVVKALGGHGELVRHPSELQPALERAFESGKPALVNVLTDPDVVYPRKAVLA